MKKAVGYSLVAVAAVLLLGSSSPDGAAALAPPRGTWSSPSCSSTPSSMGRRLTPPGKKGCHPNQNQQQQRSFWFQQLAAKDDSNKDDDTVVVDSAALSSSQSQQQQQQQQYSIPLLCQQDDARQRLGVVFIAGGLAAGTAAFVSLLSAFERALPAGWFAAWRDFTWPLPLGLMFVAAGAAHFAMKETFVAMVPPVGTWGGLWRVPAPGADQLGLSPAEYHAYWTGAAELGGGLLLVAAGVGGVCPVPIPAFLLLLLTAAVTPANIYMATHDVQPPDLPPIPYPEGHVGRGALQCVLLGLFWKLAFQ